MTVIITVYEAQGTESHGGFGHHTFPIGYYSTAWAAESAGKGKSDWGSNGTVVPRKAVYIDGKLYLLASDQPIDLDDAMAKAMQDTRATALKKLTPEERKALGLDK